MRSIISAAAVLMALNTARGEARSTRLTPLTVCEVLERLHSLRGKRVAILGRLDCESDPIDAPTCFLAETSCRRVPTVESETFTPSIFLQNRGANAPHAKAKLNNVALQTKLKLIQERTTLGTHKEWIGKQTDGKINWGWDEMPDQWAVAYGRLVLAPGWKPSPSCETEKGCQPWEHTPVSLVTDGGMLARIQKKALPRN